MENNNMQQEFMATKKQFTIIYDDSCKEYSTILNTLVSECEELKNIEHSVKKYKKDMALTDKDCVVFLGKDASNDYRNNFKDVFSKYGIHIGYRGTKAWIYCEKTKWNKKTYGEFHEALLQLYVILDMNPSRVEESINYGVKEYVNTGNTTIPTDIKPIQELLWSSVVISTIIVNPLKYIGPIGWLIYLIQRWIKALQADSKRIDQQYRYAIASFFALHLKDYMNLNSEV